ncbi:MAG: hypothetical protein LBL45_00310 [Treponema sp.]|nr:hypothetical protein [Treponema sp.]
MGIRFRAGTTTHFNIGNDITDREANCYNNYGYNNNSSRPQTHVSNMAQYDAIMLGYPIWRASILAPIASFLDEYDLSGKTVIPFCSHESGRFWQSLTAIAKLEPGAKMGDALSVHYSGDRSIANDITARLILNIAFTVLLLCALVYRATGDIAHEWIGVAVCAACIAHNALNWKWYKNIFKGIYNLRRGALTAVNLLLALAFVLLIITGLLHSRIPI